VARSQQWKVWEREVARDLGGERTGPRGLGLPDVSNIPARFPFNLFAPECKYGQRLALRGADIAQATKNARGRKWGLFLREAKTGTRLVVIPYTDFLILWESYNQQEDTNV
jgi:hypothetical protein